VLLLRRNVLIGGIAGSGKSGGLCKTSIIAINRVDFQNIEKAGDTPRQIIGNGSSAR
jgi:hypothetical protein